VQSYVAAHVPGVAHLTTLNDLSLNTHLGIRFLVANLPEIEFPLADMSPRTIIPCGPMIRPATPLAEADSTLAKWLARAPTVYVNLGTHVRLDEGFAIEMATALRIAIDHVNSVLWRDPRLKGLQVLWKLMRSSKGRDAAYEVAKPGCKVYEILGEDMREDRVRIVEWFDAEPTAVLEAGTVVCAVHHGGANSFLEAVRYVLPLLLLSFSLSPEFFSFVFISILYPHVFPSVHPSFS